MVHKKYKQKNNHESRICVLEKGENPTKINGSIELDKIEHILFTIPKHLNTPLTNSQRESEYPSDYP